jgi:predicted nicotinamide N-methyase
LETLPPEALKNNTAIDVGSGTGFVGIAAAVLGAHVTLADLPYCLPNLGRVVAANAGTISARHDGHVPLPQVVPLDWTNPAASKDSLPLGPDYILGADVVWVPELIQPLVQTLSYLVGPGPSRTVILLAHQTRSHASDTLLWSLLREQGFAIEQIPIEQHHPKWRADAIQLYRITKS